MGHIGILGGSFDPFHYGHLDLFNKAKEILAYELTKMVHTKEDADAAFDDIIAELENLDI